ncbi:POT family protein [Colletotrichum tabaci]|uniref:POT family protein n=1 Tax=Colletotrichum tabaci TaxID=1209068 RepID=A0AAV9T4J1_9PEZI
MSTGANLEVVEAARADYPAIEKGVDAGRKPGPYTGDMADGRDSHDTLGGPNGEVYPTEEELLTLRRTHGTVDWLIYSIGFVEMCERFAYYGTTAVFVNFIAYPLPPGSTTGAGGTHEQAGALGLGQRASTALTLFNSFWSYVMPLVGGYLADTYWGRYLTIQWAIVVATFGHILIIVAAVPLVISNPSGALAAFIIGLVFFGTGVGWFKANISPLIAEQYELTQPRATVQTIPGTGERVIVDPVMTISRVYMRYYFLINVGALVGQVSMVYAEKYVGFWLSYLLPTIMFFFCPVVMLACRKRYAKRPPTGSVLGKSIALIGYGLKQGGGVAEMRKDVFWERIKPSRVAARPAWMTFDDAWVDEVRRGVMACTVFLWFPVFWLAYGQMTNNLINQAATMRLDGIPNDIITNLNPFALLIFIPICDKVIYPAVERAGLRFTPIKKIALGFLCATLSMVVAAVIQHFIYQRAPCGYGASDTDCIRDNGPPDMTIWIQTPCYILIALSEIFASITGLEYAFTKAPKNMRGLVTGVFWFVHAFSSAIAQAFVGLAADPLLVWLYTCIAIISCLGGVGFWLMFRKLDKEEDALNALPESTYKGRGDAEPESKAV